MLTTAMLTKINDLRRARRSIFFVATNRLRAFDSAVTRPGRFDMQVGPRSHRSWGHQKRWGNLTRGASSVFFALRAALCGHSEPSRSDHAVWGPPRQRPSTVTSRCGGGKQWKRGIWCQRGSRSGGGRAVERCRL